MYTYGSIIKTNIVLLEPQQNGFPIYISIGTVFSPECPRRSCGNESSLRIRSNGFFSFQLNPMNRLD